MVISKSCFWWFVWYWRRLKLRKLGINDCVYASPGLVSESGLRILGCWIYIYFWSDCSWEAQIWEKWGNHQKKKFFVNNFIEAIILFNEENQGLLKLHVPLGWWWRRDLEEICRAPMNKKMGEETKIKGFIVKFGETPFEGLWKSCETVHVWWSYEKCLYQKVGLSWEVTLPGIGLSSCYKGFTSSKV